MSTTSIKEAKKEKIKIIEWLAEQFPQAFFTRPRDIKPLKIGILDDVIDFYERLDNPSFSKKQLKEAVSYYSGSPSYLKSQTLNSARLDLFGNEVDEVTESQAHYARQRYEQRYGQPLRKAKK